VKLEESVTILDVVTLGAIAVLALYGFKTGFVWELFNFGSLFLGFIAATYLHDIVAENIFYRLGDTAAQTTAYIVVFVAVAAPLFIAAHYLKEKVASSKLKVADQVGGCLFGAVQGAIVVSITLWVLIHFTGTITPDYVENSRVSAYVMRRTGTLSRFVPGRGREAACAFFARETPRVVEGLGNLKREARTDNSGNASNPVSEATASQPTAQEAQHR
jgi:uncharacterized membrane protein required for colicin V production